MKPKPQVGVIVSKVATDKGLETDPMQDADVDMEACAEDLLRAIQAKDAKLLAKAIKAAMDLYESRPHEEADHSYDAQNEAAESES